MPSETTPGNPYAYTDNQEVLGPPEYLSPVERRGVPFLPYRGTNFHGVEPTEIPIVDDGTETVDIPDGTVVTGVFQPPEEDLNPVPVRIVDTATHEFKQWRTWQAPTDNTSPRLVANRKEGQSTVQVKNCAAAGRVWVGPDPGVSTYTGFPLNPGESATFDGEAPVYAIADPTAVGFVTLAMLSQFSTAQ